MRDQGMVGQLTAIALACLVSLGLAGASVAAPAPAPPTAKDFARAPTLTDVSVAPDGKHLAALTSPDGVSVNVTVWDLDALGKPVTIGATHMRFLNVAFLKSDRLLVTAVQTLDLGSTRTHLVKSYVTDLEGKSFAPLLPDHASGQGDDEALYDQLVDADIISTLPKDPRHVLVEDRRADTEGDVYSVDVYSMSAGRVMHGSDKFGSYQADLNGDLRARLNVDYDNGKIYLAQQLKNPKTGAWEEHFRSYAKDRNVTDVVGFTTDPDVVLIATVRDGDKRGIYEYDIDKRSIIEPAFENKLFDAGRAVFSRSPKTFGDVIGFYYDAERPRIYWLDGGLQAQFDAVAKALGASAIDQDWTDPGTGLKATISVVDAAGVSVVSASDDRSSVIFEKSGPRQPPQYFLLHGGKLQLLGGERPWIDATTLGTTRLVEYPARDGLLIPAFLTTPPKDVFGPGPYPTLIEPHGGPWARDEMDWDLAGWVQYFASRGYAVLQPQYRGSEGWGQKLWRAGDAEWGLKMQDDKDDGVKWLIAQHVADPKRVAMFGYSYGGYAALAAAIRPNGLYQCTISGAGAGDLEKISYATSDNRWQREFQHPTIAGLDALAHAREAQIPVFLYHGDRDQTVDVEQSRKFAAALKSAGKPYRYVEIKDMGHQFKFMTPAMLEEQLVDVDDFLKTGCKSGGL